MKTYWRYQSELEGLTPDEQDELFQRLGVADSREGAIESLAHFMWDWNGRPYNEVEVMETDTGIFLTVLDSDFPR
jgi:hypothetical protein